MKRMRCYGFLSVPFALLLLLAFFSAAPAQAAASWNVQTVDERGAGTGNGYCPIVVDSNGVPSIAYTGSDLSHYFVMYARWNSSLGGFSTQRVATGFAADIVLDANSSPVMLCGGSEGLQYVSWNGQGWAFQRVGDGGYGVIAFDSLGNPHVAYTIGTTVKYASRSGSGWTTETVDTYSNPPTLDGQLSLALNSNDTPYILYAHKPYLESVKLAVWTGSGWDIQTVVSEVYDLGNMVLDSKGYPHFVYRVTGAPLTVMYARWTGAAWETEIVASEVSYTSIFPGSLALDSLGYPHICYVSGEGLMYAGWTGAAWNIQTVELMRGGPCYLALDSNRIPHISYRAGLVGGSSSTTVIKYAVAAEPAPLYSPLPLQLGLAAVAIGAAVAVAYLWKKKT